MADIHYKVTFLDYWHLSSGLSGGTRLDSLVVKDDDNLPYIPGKTLKGLLREHVSELYDCNTVYDIFGFQSDKNSRCFDENKENKASACYFTNATLSKEIREEIVSNALQDNLYDIIASTKIDPETYTAEDNSLREIEVVIPLTLEGAILGVNPQHISCLEDGLHMIKRMGLNRNRGLGRCTMEVLEVSHA